MDKEYKLYIIIIERKHQIARINVIVLRNTNLITF